MDSVERKLIKEVLNEDTNAIGEIIDAHPNRLNFVSQCGESPLGIAIYMRNFDMVRLLLRSGAHPNHLNKHGDASFHIAARIGEIDMLRIIFETNLCNLLIRNHEGKRAHDIAMEPPSGVEVNLLHLFGEWNQDIRLEEELEVMKGGRKECAEFLAEMCRLDVIRQRQEDVDQAIHSNAYDSRMRRVLGDSQLPTHHQYEMPIVLPKYPIPTVVVDTVETVAIARARAKEATERNSSSNRQVDAEGREITLINGNFNNRADSNVDDNYTKVWINDQVDRFHRCPGDVILVSRGIFVKDYVNQLITNQVDQLK